MSHRRTVQFFNGCTNHMIRTTIFFIILSGFEDQKPKKYSQGINQTIVSSIWMVQPFKKWALKSPVLGLIRNLGVIKVDIIQEAAKHCVVYVAMQPFACLECASFKPNFNPFLIIHIYANVAHCLFRVSSLTSTPF